MPYAHVRQMVIERDGELRMEGLPVRAGERVQVVVIPQDERAGSESKYPLHGIPVEYEMPFEPAIDPDEWEANR